MSSQRVSHKYSLDHKLIIGSDIVISHSHFRCSILPLGSELLGYGNYLRKYLRT